MYTNKTLTNTLVASLDTDYTPRGLHFLGIDKNRTYRLIKERGI